MLSMESVVSRIRRVFFNQLDQGVIDRMEPRVIVASKDASQELKDVAQFVADGTDDQNTIQQAIDSFVNGGNVILSEGTFNITGSISMPSNMTLSGQGSATILFLPDNTDSVFDFIINSDTTNGNENIFVMNLTINGNEVNNIETQHGILFDNVSNVTVRNVSIEDINGGGVHLFSATNVFVLDNTIDTTGDNLIFLDINSSLITISGNLLSNSADGRGIRVEGSNSNINNNIVSNVRQGIQVLKGSSNVISLNVCRECDFDGIVFSAVGETAENMLALSNFCFNNARIGFLIIEGTNNSAFIGNYSLNNSNQGMRIQSGNTGIVISNNYLSGNANRGLDIFSSNTDNFLISNNFFLSNTDTGMRLQGNNHSCQSNYLLNNGGSGGDHDGIFVDNATNAFITNNHIRGSDRHGITITSGSSDTVVVHNMLRGAEGTGQAISDSGTNTTTTLSGNITT